MASWRPLGLSKNRRRLLGYPDVVFSKFGLSICARRQWPGVTERTGTGLTQADFRQRPENARSSKTFQHLWNITRVFPVWTARCPNAVVSPFGPSICDRLGGLLSRLAAFLGPLGSLLGRPRALLSTARCPNVVFSPFGPSIRARRGGLLGRLAAILGPLGSLWGRPRALLSLSDAPLRGTSGLRGTDALTRSLRGLGHPRRPRRPPR